MIRMGIYKSFIHLSVISRKNFLTEIILHILSSKEITFAQTGFKFKFSEGHNQDVPDGGLLIRRVLVKLLRFMYENEYKERP